MSTLRGRNDQEDLCKGGCRVEIQTLAQNQAQAPVMRPEHAPAREVGAVRARLPPQEHHYAA